MEVTFNLDDPDPFGTDPGRVFWRKYDACLRSLSEICSGGEQYYDFEITDAGGPPLCNLILELTAYDDYKMVVTFKCERCSVYLIAFRCGRGDPEPNNNENNGVWKQCDDMSLLTGNFEWARFDARYSPAENLGVGALGVMALREAVIGLWNGENEQKWFRTIAVHISEPVRYRCIADHFKKVIRVNIYGEVELTRLMELFIKHWELISNAVQDLFQFQNTQNFRIDHPELEVLTYEQVTTIIRILKRRRIIKED